MELNNEVKLSGQIVTEYPHRRTPDGLLVITFLLEHQSTQIEAGKRCEVRCRVFCVMLGAKENLVATLEKKFVTIFGFLSQNSKLQLVLHVNQINFLDKGI